MALGFDVIVVGAGSAGCVLANRLSEDPACSVALVEAGGEPDRRLAPIPGAASWMQNTRHDWAFTTVPQKELFGRRISYPRGKVLGGTSVLNYLVYVRGNAGDYDGWAQQGNAGWSYQDVLPYFMKAERNAVYADAFHGTDGPLGVETNTRRHPLCDRFIEAATSRGVPFNPDFNGKTQWGCGYYQATIRNGRRCSTADAYLDPVRGRGNLTVFKNCIVTRIAVDGGRATGLDLIDNGRETRSLTATSEVVLAAGSVGSPHILMLSGLGPADHLRSHGIKVQADVPDVGQNLEDHLTPNGTTRYLKDPDAIYGAVPDSPEAAIEEFERTGGGILATHHLDAGAFYSIDPGTSSPQCQALFTPGVAEFYRVDGVPDRSRFTLGGYLCRPKSRGSITLASANPLDAPLIDPNYLSEPDDLRLMVEQINWNRDVLGAAVFDEICVGSAQPEDDLEAFVRRTSNTVWHPTSTCRMGAQGRSVVGPDLRVHAVDGLSICDASVMPTMVSGNTNAPTIMVAEKGSDLIKRRIH